MKYIIKSFKMIAITLILALGVSYVSAWATPDSAPTGGNIAAPINTSDVLQTKTGTLALLNIGSQSLETFGSAFFATVTGNVGIGTSTPQVKLDIIGDLRVSGNILKSGIPCTDGTVNATLNGHCYSNFAGELINWMDGQAVCHAFGGYLATITSAEENSLIATLVGNKFVWLGGHDWGVEGSWKWTTREPWSYNVWDTGEPSNSGNEDCLVFLGDRDRWNDSNCGSSYELVCERNY